MVAVSVDAWRKTSTISKSSNDVGTTTATENSYTLPYECMWVFEIQTKSRDRGVPALIVIVIIIIYAHALNALQVN